MADFCKCGSLVINGSCTRKKCNYHKHNLIESATYEQINYIKDLKDQLNDDSEVDYGTLTKPEASMLIEELLERKEMGC